MMLCKYCESFDYDLMISEFGYRHYATYGDLEASAEQGCEVCSLVVRKVRLCGPKRNPEIWTGPVRCRYNRGRQFMSWACHRPLENIIICTDSGIGPSRASRSFYLQSTGDPLSHLIKPRIPSQDIFSDISIKQMKAWLARCQYEHTRCPNIENHPLPTRVIDVGSITKEPRLVCTNNALGTWTALSHCWGAIRPLVTEKNTLADHCASLPLSKLPPTFREALLITREIGIQYIWIDSLCILQDSREDWLKESAQMESVYRNAVVTILAEGVPDSSVEMASVSSRNKSFDFHIPTAGCHSSEQNAAGKIYFAEDENHQDYWDRGPLSERGWTLQEEILSPRILQFTKNLTFWRCVETRASEMFPDPGTELELNPSNVLSSYHAVIDGASKKSAQWSFSYDHNIMAYWYAGVVDAYMLRRVTFETDRLNAIGGIARALQPHFKQTLYLPSYHAGLWAHDMCRGLLWSPLHKKYQRGGTRYKQYVAPSWSWASLCFEAPPGERLSNRSIYRDLLGIDFIPLAVIQNVVIENENEDTFGKVESGRLDLCGQCCAICTCLVPLAFLDERTFEHTNTVSKPKEYLENHSSVVTGRNQAEDTASDKFFWDDCSLGRAAGEHDQFRMRNIGRSQCRQGAGIEHSEVLYVKLARFELRDYRYHPVVAGLILRERNTGTEMLYERVGRVLMTEKRAAYIDSVQSDEVRWPIRTITIV
jgi:hypothetical protein